MLDLVGNPEDRFSHKPHMRKPVLGISEISLAQTELHEDDGKRLEMKQRGCVQLPGSFEYHSFLQVYS